MGNKNSDQPRNLLLHACFFSFLNCLSLPNRMLFAHKCMYINGMSFKIMDVKWLLACHKRTARPPVLTPISTHAKVLHGNKPINKRAPNTISNLFKIYKKKSEEIFLNKSRHPRKPKDHPFESLNLFPGRPISFTYNMSTRWPSAQ